MGRNKEYRQRLKYQVSSALKKTLENQLRVELHKNIGFSHAEAELLSFRLTNWLQNSRTFRSPNQILVRGALHRTDFSRGKASLQGKLIKITPFHASDLALQLEFGLKAMQLGRILRVIEEACSQDSLIDAKQLSLLFNVTPTSLRSRLREVTDLGIYVPIRGMSRKDREQNTLFRSTYLFKTYLSEENILEARRSTAMGKDEFNFLLSEFTRFISDPKRQTVDPEKRQWLELAEDVPDKTFSLSPRLFTDLFEDSQSPEALFDELQEDYGLSPVKIRVIQGLLDEIINNLHSSRANGDVIYWAVSSSESAGKPLEECELVPVKISLSAAEDQPTADNQDLNRLSEIKFRKVLRYATQAKYAGAYLTYADLAYLMGIHPEAIRRLINLNKEIVVPLRGIECDIGRGVSHKKKVIELYLQMYTETEIVARTSHSYQSIEEYIREFGKVWLLHERGFPPAMIRKVVGRSMRLVQTYLDLVKEYDSPEYAFRFQHIRTFVERADKPLKKGEQNS